MSNRDRLRQLEKLASRLIGARCSQCLGPKHFVEVSVRLVDGPNLARCEVCGQLVDHQGRGTADRVPASFAYSVEVVVHPSE